MSEVVGAVVGALAVVGIPVVAWFSRRATREGRLLMRVSRLGSAYALMPGCPEKETFGMYLTNAIGDLNVWLDPDNAKRRRLIRRTSGWTYAIGISAALVILPSVDTDTTPWLTSVLGAAIGVAIAIVTMVSNFFLERNARQQSARAAKAGEDAAAAIRIEALRLGVPLLAVPERLDKQGFSASSG